MNNMVSQVLMKIKSSRPAVTYQIFGNQDADLAFTIIFNT